MFMLCHNEYDSVNVVSLVVADDLTKTSAAIMMT